MALRAIERNAPGGATLAARLRTTGSATDAAALDGLSLVQIVITPSGDAASRKSLDLCALFVPTPPHGASSPFSTELRDRSLHGEPVR